MLTENTQEKYFHKRRPVSGFKDVRLLYLLYLLPHPAYFNARFKKNEVNKPKLGIFKFYFGFFFKFRY